MPPERFDKGPRWACGLVSLLGLALRWAIALRPIDFVDRLFVPDDTYYTLSIARALAHGLGPTADGLHLTNGFQPLLALVMVPVFWLSNDPDTGLRSAMLLLALADAALAFALGELVRRSGGPRSGQAALIATTLWAASPLAISYALGGLETSLALLACALLALAWSSARESGSLRRYLGAGVLAGAAVLARIDAALLVAGLGLWELLRGSRKGAAGAALGGALALAPWWLYELARFHTVIPTSGEAVHQLMNAWKADDRWPFSEAQLVGVSLGAILEAPLGRALDLRALCSEDGLTAIIFVPVVAGLLVAGIVRLVQPGPSAMPVRLLLFFGVAVWPFYVLWVPQYPYFPRYLAPTHVAVTILLALAAARALEVDPDALPRWLVVGAGLLLFTPSLVRSMGFLFAEPDKSADTSFQGIKGYRAPIREILAAAPHAAVIGSLQSGALGYFGGALRPDVRVFNLDGVVDEEAAAAFKARRLGELSEARGMTHLADFGFNVESFRRFSGDPRLGPKSFREVMRAQSQGSNQFRLVEVHWP